MKPHFLIVKLDLWEMVICKNVELYTFFSTVSVVLFLRLGKSSVSSDPSHPPRADLVPTLAVAQDEGCSGRYLHQRNAAYHFQVGHVHHLLGKRFSNN